MSLSKVWINKHLGHGHFCRRCGLNYDEFVRNREQGFPNPHCNVGFGHRFTWESQY